MHARHGGKEQTREKREGKRNRRRLMVDAKRKSAAGRRIFFSCTVIQKLKATLQYQACEVSKQQEAASKHRRRAGWEGKKRQTKAKSLHHIRERDTIRFPPGKQLHLPSGQQTKQQCYSNSNKGESRQGSLMEQQYGHQRRGKRQKSQGQDETARAVLPQASALHL